MAGSNGNCIAKTTEQQQQHIPGTYVLPPSRTFTHHDDPSCMPACLPVPSSVQCTSSTHRTARNRVMHAHPTSIRPKLKRSIDITTRYVTCVRGVCLHCTYKIQTARRLFYFSVNAAITTPVRSYCTSLRATPAHRPYYKSTHLILILGLPFSMSYQIIVPAFQPLTSRTPLSNASHSLSSPHP
jgi:hypothetical protein